MHFVDRIQNGRFDIGSNTVNKILVVGFDFINDFLYFLIDILFFKIHIYLEKSLIEKIILKRVNRFLCFGTIVNYRCFTFSEKPVVETLIKIVDHPCLFG